MKKKMQCKRGHDTSSANSRDSSNGCKACKAERNAASCAYQYSTPEVKAQRAAYRKSPEGKAREATYQRSPEAKAKRAVYEALPATKAYHSAYRNSPEGKYKARRSNLKVLGWTPEMFAQTLLEQGNVCASCREPFTEKDPPHADHKHVEPPEPRGVLHSSCNSVIGLLKESPARIRAAADYVERWS